MNFRAAPICVRQAFYLPALRGGLVWDDHQMLDGTAIGGGRGSVAKAIIGSLLVLILTNGLINLGISGPINSTILGAILLTGYLGGAVATHLRVGDPLFSHVLFPVYRVCLSGEGFTFERTACERMRLRRRPATMSPIPQVARSQRT